MQVAEIQSMNRENDGWQLTRRRYQGDRTRPTFQPPRTGNRLTTPEWYSKRDRIECGCEIREPVYKEGIRREWRIGHSGRWLWRAGYSFFPILSVHSWPNGELLTACLFPIDCRSLVGTLHILARDIFQQHFWWGVVLPRDRKQHQRVSKWTIEDVQKSLHTLFGTSSVILSVSS